MSKLRKVTLTYLGLAFLSAGLALLGTLPLDRGSSHIWPIHSELFLPNFFMGMTWGCCVLALLGMLVFVLLFRGDSPESQPPSKENDTRQ